MKIILILLACLFVVTNVSADERIVKEVAWNGVRTQVVQQTLNNVDVFDTITKRHNLPDGTILEDNRFLLIQSIRRDHSLEIDMDRIKQKFAPSNIQWIETKPVYFELDGEVIPGIRVDIEIENILYTYVFDDRTYEILFSRRNVFECSEAQPIETQKNYITEFWSYIESPFPGIPGPNTPNGWQQTVEVPRFNILEPRGNLGGPSPFGWTYTNRLRGNNVHTIYGVGNLGENEFDIFSPGFGRFHFPIGFDEYSDNYPRAISTNTFVIMNQLHDYLWARGWTEEWSNTQDNNFGRGGVGGDATRIKDFFTGHTNSHLKNNAFWSGSEIDGSPNNIAMFEFTGLSGDGLDRHSGLESLVIVHENTHGMFMRMTGSYNPPMHEGWCDFIGLLYTSNDKTSPFSTHAAGGWLTWHFLDSECHDNNYYSGIRRYPYSTDLTKNPLTLGDGDPSTFDVPKNVPRTCLNIRDFSSHSIGEIWCSLLWETWGLVLDRYGFVQGKNFMMELCIDSMKLHSVNDYFLKARDNLILADMLKTGGENRSLIWTAFAKRGAGIHSFVSYNDQIYIENFDIPDWGDYNQDGSKDQADIDMFLIDFADGFLRADLDIDHVITDKDLVIFNRLFNE